MNEKIEALESEVRELRNTIHTVKDILSSLVCSKTNEQDNVKTIDQKIRDAENRLVAIQAEVHLDRSEHPEGRKASAILRDMLKFRHTEMFTRGELDVLLVELAGVLDNQVGTQGERN